LNSSTLSKELLSILILTIDIIPTAIQKKLAAPCKPNGPLQTTNTHALLSLEEEGQEGDVLKDGRSACQGNRPVTGREGDDDDDDDDNDDDDGFSSYIPQ
jgi:hypothetical protein